MFPRQTKRIFTPRVYEKRVILPKAAQNFWQPVRRTGLLELTRRIKSRFEAQVIHSTYEELCDRHS